MTIAYYRFLSELCCTKFVNFIRFRLCFLFILLIIIEDYAANSIVNLERNATGQNSGNSIRMKAKTEFLENLNATLAKQGLSNRAFAVRNFINSKALVSIENNLIGNYFYYPFVVLTKFQLSFLINLSSLSLFSFHLV